MTAMYLITAALLLVNKSGWVTAWIGLEGKSVYIVSKSMDLLGCHYLTPFPIAKPDFSMAVRAQRDRIIQNITGISFVSGDRSTHIRNVLIWNRYESDNSLSLWPLAVE